jgi:hypothetical protein
MMIDNLEQDIRIVPSKKVLVQNFQFRKTDRRFYKPYKILRKKNLQDRSGHPDFTQWIMPPQPQRYIKGMAHDHF